MLCFARKPEKFFPNARLRCAVFGTLDTTVTLDMKDFSGDVFTLINRAEEYILEHINIGMRLEFGEKFGVKFGETTQKTTQKILELIAANPRISRSELAAEIGITADGIKYQLDKMRREGILKRIGPDKGGYWEVGK